MNANQRSENSQNWKGLVGDCCVVIGEYRRLLPILDLSGKHTTALGNIWDNFGSFRSPLGRLGAGRRSNR